MSPSQRPGKPCLYEALEGVAEPLAVWAVATLDLASDDLLPAWDDVAEPQRDRFIEAARMVIATRPAPEQRMWDAVSRRAMMRGLSAAQADGLVYAVIWSAMVERL